MDGIQTTYTDSDSNSGVSTDMFLRVTDFKKDLVLEDDDMLWNLTYKGFNIQAQHSDANNLFALYISGAGYPPIILKFKGPFAERIFVSLPGGGLLLRIIALHEVSMWNLDRKYSRNEEQELNRICQLMEQMKKLEGNEYCQSMVWVHKSNRKHVYSMELFAGLLASDEALVAVSVFRNLIAGPKR